METEIIQKAHQDGDAHPKNPNLVWSSAAAGGKGDWRKRKDGAAKPTTTQQQHSKPQATPTEDSKQGDKTETDSDSKQSKDDVYKKPDAKVTYKTQVPPKGVDGVEIPSQWQKTIGGKLRTYNRDFQLNFYHNADDDRILKTLNNVNAMPELRQMCYDEAMARGIDESKIDTSGTLKAGWDKVAKQQLLTGNTNSDDDDEEAGEDYDLSGLQGMDIDAFMENYRIPGTDEFSDGWNDYNDKTVQAEFNKLTTLNDRKRYDAFRDYQQRKSPRYKNPDKQLQLLSALYGGILLNNKFPMMVAAGGAGAGKTTRFFQVADAYSKKEFDPGNQNPGDDDYDFVMVDKDVDDEKELRALMSAHNGKLIVFDDKDKLLISDSNPIKGLMKAITDGEPKNRRFQNTITGKQDKFTGRLLFLTNKTMDILTKDEDHKAIMSRGKKGDIHFTINENLELLKERYKTMGGRMESIGTQAEEDEVRKKVYDIIVENKKMLDPSKFTVRKFIEALEVVDDLSRSNAMSKTSSSAKALFGQFNWEDDIIDILNKGEDLESNNNIEKATDAVDLDGGNREMILAFYKRDKKKALALFGEDIINACKEGKRGFSSMDTEFEEGDDEVKKSFENDFSSMSIEAAKSLLGLS